ncbi:MAG: hypothetical protein JW943_07490 [Deltaproteobacteria bacterium]|nr:hypothetical protein [Deltaproteobacteria bacterium]
MLANRILNVLIGITAIFVIPLQLVTTLVLGLIVELTFGILLLPISLIWILLSFPMIGASWLSAKARWLREPVGILGIPWAIITSTFVALMPSMGEMESRAAKLMLAESWPYSWEFWKFQTQHLSIWDPDIVGLREVLERISKGDALKQRTVERISAGEALDPNV